MTSKVITGLVLGAALFVTTAVGSFSFDENDPVYSFNDFQNRYGASFTTNFDYATVRDIEAVCYEQYKGIFENMARSDTADDIRSVDILVHPGFFQELKDAHLPLSLFKAPFFPPSLFKEPKTPLFPSSFLKRFDTLFLPDSSGYYIPTDYGNVLSVDLTALKYPEVEVYSQCIFFTNEAQYTRIINFEQLKNGADMFALRVCNASKFFGCNYISSVTMRIIDAVLTNWLYEPFKCFEVIDLQRSDNNQ
jgi:hypothetical protein